MFATGASKNVKGSVTSHPPFRLSGSGVDDAVVLFPKLPVVEDAAVVLSTVLPKPAMRTSGIMSVFTLNALHSEFELHLTAHSSTVATRVLLSLLLTVPRR